MSGRRAKQKAETRTALLAAARVVLKRDGLAGTTCRAVTQQAGVANGTFFVHFPDVAHLVEALLDEHLTIAVEDAVRGAARKQGIVERLVHAARVLFDSYDGEPDLSRAWLTSSLFGGAPGGLAESRLSTFEAWVRWEIDVAVKVHEVPEVDPSTGFIVFFSLYFGLLVSGLRGRLSRRAQLRVLREGLGRFFHGEVA